MVLFAINAFITLRLFHVAYTRQMGSIEASFIGLARYIRDHFPHFTWFPLWYGGIPFADAYPPLLHFAVAGVAAATGASPGLAYHIVTAAMYALGPVALFWLAMRLGAGRTAAFLAALGYSLISPTCWLVQQARSESGGWFAPRRLVLMVVDGEGPHVASLVLLTLSIGLLDRALEKRTPWTFVLASLSMAATALCNWIGAAGLAMAVAAYLLAGFCKTKQNWIRAAAIGIYAYAITMPWATLSTLATIRSNAPRLVGFHSSVRPLLVVAISFLGLAWILKRSSFTRSLGFAILFLYSTAAMALGGYWWHVNLLPQEHRYHLEMDLAFWLVAALGSAQLRAAKLDIGRWLPIRPAMAGALIAVMAVPLVNHQYRQARGLEMPIAIESTAEYKISSWLGEHMPGRRVFAPGSVSFWMNAFSDTPMLVGGFDNGIRNEILWAVNYQLLAGDKTAAALDWLKAFGCDAIVGDDPESHEVFHPYSHPERLHSLPEWWRDGPEVIYAVPRRGSLAHVIRTTDQVREIPAAYDPKALAPYLAALDDPSLPSAWFRWRDPSSASITAKLQPELLLSVQVAWDQGWRASVNGEPRRTWADKIGQIVVEPRCSGACMVELSYTGGFELRFARWCSLLALLAGAAWIGLTCRRNAG